MSTETNNEKFIRLANARAGAAIDRIRQLRTLGSAYYEATPEQIETIVNTLHDEVNEAEEYMRGKTAPVVKKGIL